MRKQLDRGDSGFRSLIPLSSAAVELRLTRDQVRRRIENGTVAGAYVAGKWFVRREAIAGAGPETDDPKGAA